MTKTVDLKEYLANLRTALTAIEAVDSLDNIRAGKLTEIERENLESSGKALFESLERAEEILRNKALENSPVFLKLSQSDREFWMNDIEPNRPLLKAIYYRVCDPLLAELLIDVGDRTVTGSRAFDAFRFAIDHTTDEVDQWTEDPWCEEGRFDSYDFDMASKILEWPVFTPDLWYQNLQELRAVMITSGSPLPKSVARSLTEVYRAFVFGQYLATAAMARATLEQSICSRAEAGILKIDISDPDNRTYVAGLQTLIARTARALQPFEEKKANYIRHAANDVMHALQRREDMSRIPEARSRALRCIKNLQGAIEQLYST